MADLDAARRALTDALGADAVLADPLSLRLYARDASLVEGNASVVVLPTSIEQIQDAVRIAAAHGLPVVPRGSGTGLAGAATPIDDAVVVVTAKMNRILEVRTRGSPRLGRARAVQPRPLDRAAHPSAGPTPPIPRPSRSRRSAGT